MNCQRRFRGSSIMEYIIPVALIGIGVGAGLYAISTNGGFFSNIMYSSAGKVDSAGGRISFGSGASVNGIYMDTDGKIYVSNNEGNQVRVPLSFYDKYKNNLQKYLNDGKFNTSGSSLGQETSGAVGIEDITASNKANTIIYSAMIEMASEQIEDKKAANLLAQMSQYGYKMGELETELINVKRTIDSYHETFDLKAKAFWKAQKAYKDAEAAYNKESNQNNKNAMQRALEQMELAAGQYTTAKDNFKESSTQYLGQATTYFNDLKEKTGMSYDKILTEIDASTDIDDDIKEIVLPIGNKIKDVKDSVDMIEKLVGAFNLEFDKISSTYESFSDNFKTLEIVIDENAGDETFDALDETFRDENPDFSIESDNSSNNNASPEENSGDPEETETPEENDPPENSGNPEN